MAQKIVIWCPHVRIQPRKIEPEPYDLWFLSSTRDQTQDPPQFFVKTSFFVVFFFLVFGFFFRSVRFFYISCCWEGERTTDLFFFLYVSFSFFWSLVQAWGDVKGYFFFRRGKEKDFKLIYKVGLFFLFLNPVTTISTTIFIFRSFLVVVIFFFHREVGATSN